MESIYGNNWENETQADPVRDPYDKSVMHQLEINGMDNKIETFFETEYTKFLKDEREFYQKYVKENVIETSVDYARAYMAYLESTDSKMNIGKDSSYGTAKAHIGILSEDGPEAYLYIQGRNGQFSKLLEELSEEFDPEEVKANRKELSKRYEEECQLYFESDEYISSWGFNPQTFRASVEKGETPSLP